MKKFTKSAAILSAIVLIFVSVVIVCLIFHLRFNTSASMPIGIYRVIQTPLHKCDLVEICLPKNIAEIGLLRNYLGGGSCKTGAEPLIKQVVALQGDAVDVTPKGIFINGSWLPHSEILLKDTQGRDLLAVYCGHYVLKKNEIWVYGNHNYKSWDSRYFGAVDMADVKDVLTPVITFD